MPHKNTLHERTRYLLKNRPRTLTLLHIATVLEIKFDWIQRFNNGRVVEPGADKVQSIYEYLAKKQLDV